MKKLKKQPRKQLEKFSSIFTQLGLVLVLFIVYVSLEHESPKNKVAITYNDSSEGIYDVSAIPVLIKKRVEVQKSEPKPKPKVVLDKKIDVIKNNVEITKKVIIEPTDTEVEKNFLINTNEAKEDEDIDDKEDPKPISINFIQKAPVFKGCEGLSETENRECLVNKLKRLVNIHFNTDLANDLGLKSGKKRILTQFVIDKSGFVTDVQVRAPHPRLQKEANRVLKKIPKFKPGIQNDKPAKVKYTLPISFMVE